MKRVEIIKRYKMEQLADIITHYSNTTTFKLNKLHMEFDSVTKKKLAKTLDKTVKNIDVDNFNKDSGYRAVLRSDYENIKESEFLTDLTGKYFEKFLFEISYSTQGKFSSLHDLHDYKIIKNAVTDTIIKLANENEEFDEQLKVLYPDQDFTKNNTANKEERLKFFVDHHISDGVMYHMEKMYKA